MTEEVFLEFRDIISDFDDIDFQSDRDCDLVGDIEDKLRVWLCRARGNHTFVFDQCCHWQHKFCSFCNTPEYPDLAGVRLKDLDLDAPEPSPAKS